jgi:glyoxylase-like metal-dependent hydrolase (beta-lactamase superfamily II)
MSRIVTRRRFLIASGIAAAAAPVSRLFAQPPAGRASATQAPATQAPAPQAPQAPRFTPVFAPIRRNVEFFTGRGGTIGYLINAGGVLVVDSQYPDAAKAFLDGLGERANHRPVDVLLNTHHHADHTGGNVAFKGVAKTIVAQTRVPALQRADNDALATPVEQVYADATFEDIWNHAIGDEMVRARKFTPAHTGGDIVVHFEQANVVHVGDLVWNNLQTFVDHTRGGSAVNWIPVCERIVATYPKDAVYICGHAGRGLPVTVTPADVLAMRDYLTALVERVRAQMAAGKSRDEIVTSTELLPKFESRGPLTQRALAGTYDELAGK